MAFELPGWEVGQSWRVATTLSHLEQHPDPFQARIIGVENIWQIEVLAIPEQGRPGEIRLRLSAELAHGNPFSASSFELRLARGAEPTSLHLASVWHGEPANTRLLHSNGAHAFFMPGESLGFLFDFPRLHSDLAPSFGEQALQPEAAFREARVAYATGMRFVFSHVFPPQGTTVRSTIEWDSGAPWYRRFLRERYNPADMIHTREIQASARLLD